MKSAQKEIRKLMRKNDFRIVDQNRHTFTWEHKVSQLKMRTSVTPSKMSAIWQIKKDMNKLLRSVA